MGGRSLLARLAMVVVGGRGAPQTNTRSCCAGTLSCCAPAQLEAGARAEWWLRGRHLWPVLRSRHSERKRWPQSGQTSCAKTACQGPTVLWGCRMGVWVARGVGWRAEIALAVQTRVRSHRELVAGLEAQEAGAGCQSVNELAEEPPRSRRGVCRTVVPWLDRWPLHLLSHSPPGAWQCWRCAGGVGAGLQYLTPERELRRACGVSRAWPPGLAPRRRAAAATCTRRHACCYKCGLDGASTPSRSLTTPPPQSPCSESAHAEGGAAALGRCSC